MRIGFDARVIGWPGLGTYTSNLLKRLAGTPGLELICFYNDETEELIPVGDKLSKLRLNEKIISRRNLGRIGELVNKAGCDLYHIPYPAVPGNLEMPLLLTAHDIIPLQYPNTLPLRYKRLLRQLLVDAIQRADHIITASLASRACLLEHFNLPESRITVIGDGVDPEFYPRAEDEIIRVSTKYGIARPYILWLGSFAPHKNIVILVEAFAALPVELGSRYTLVLAGAKGGVWKQAEKKAKQLGVIDRVFFPGRIDGADLAAIYSGADLFCFPSLFEGFGLPPLEAMACGTPVVSSNLSSLPEVVGDSGLLVEPGSASFSSAIERVLKNEELRIDYIRRGIENAARYSWEDTSLKTFQVYQSMIRS